MEKRRSDGERADEEWRQGQAMLSKDWPPRRGPLRRCPAVAALQRSRDDCRDRATTMGFHYGCQCEVAEHAGHAESWQLAANSISQPANGFCSLAPLKLLNCDSGVCCCSEPLPRGEATLDCAS
jgi:hypothetical protein